MKERETLKDKPGYNNIANNFLLTDAELQQFDELYPWTSNQKVGEILGMNTTNVSRLGLKRKLKKMNFLKNNYGLTDNQIEVLKNLYPNNTNKKVAKMLDMPDYQVQNLAKKFKLIKNKKVVMSRSRNGRPSGKKKECKRCHSKLLLKYFSKNEKYEDGYEPHCKRCKELIAKEEAKKKEIDVNRPEWVRLRNAELLKERA